MKYLDLPVYQHKDLILSALETSQVVVVESPTGSGKTTQLPVILHDSGYGKNGIIGVTQPRRIAALSVSDFIARQLGFSASGVPGCPVGYKMRFEDKTALDTRIKIMTDGILLQEMKLDPWLSRYAVMIIDEAHERSLNIDFILGLLKRVLEERKEFKVIVSSATINAEVFSEYFGECPVVKIDAQTFPVTMVYDPPLVSAAPAEDSQRDRGRSSGGGNLVMEALLAKIENITERFISEKRPGDILVFLPGEKMIKDCMSRLAFGSVGKYLHIIPLYGRLGKEEQERVFDDPPRGKTKVVIATNIAETSVTIDGITAVLDSGLAKLNFYNPRTFTSSLVESPVSKASANQRKGRAGRTREGSCYRLYSRKEFESRPLFTTEEIYRTDLSEVVLRMADLGITDYEEFDFISPPGREGIIAAVETLNLLDALEKDRTLSSTGKMMTEFPLGPRHSRIIVEAILRYPQVIEETLIAAAFLSTQSPYVLPPGEEMDARKAHHGFRDPHGDFVSYLRLYRAYEAAQNKEQFCKKNYLDERAMAEIMNVTIQLEEIVTGMNIPILSAGLGSAASVSASAATAAAASATVEDYLSCIGRGLIQFVCVRSDGGGFSGGRNAPAMYRSLTADKIMIHPGSVMFKRQDDAARYIVAGEIVRTTRTYAMSVSPLSLGTLKRISPLLSAEWGGARTGMAKTEEGKHLRRNLTNQIKLGKEVFPLETVKGKKHLTLPWEKLVSLKQAGTGGADSAVLLIDPSQYHGLRGTVTYQNHTLLAGEKLSLILTLLPVLDLEGVLNREWPRKTHFYSGDSENLRALIKNLPLVLLPVPHGKSSGRPEKKRGGKAAGGKAVSGKIVGGKAAGGKIAGKELGFIALFTDGAGRYWFRCSRGFHTALNESTASLEALIDELGDEVDVNVKHEVNLAYRKLADLLGEQA
ncbi:ATP-dependent helicase HrpA [Spirochaetia bacterium]|nr:ATP-dependent helicase HrpA [Spirochaetia bacterium]